jgi:hypothetical protein
MTLFNKKLLSGPYSDYVGDLIDNDKLFQKLPTQLFTFNNAKTPKGEELGYLTAILYLAPSNLSGYPVCPFAALAQCELPCLNTAGRGKFDATQKARIRKTLMFHQFRDEFNILLISEMHRAQRKAQRMGLTLVVRLNGTSDIAWENEVIISPQSTLKLISYAPHSHFSRNWTIFELFSKIQFYDYTKAPTRHKLPENYHLTFSYSGATSFIPIVAKWDSKRTDQNIAVVFDKVPENMFGPVINGDSNDLRFLDPINVTVGLKAKGKAKTDTTGFVVHAT